MWIALHFPDFSLQVSARSQAPDTPLAVSSGGPRPVVLCANEIASACGIHPGLSLAAARTLAGETVFLPRDSEAEKKSLENLACWALQFTSRVSLAAGDALVLEAGGSLRLFGGRARLLSAIRDSLAATGYRAGLSIAPTPSAALWLARADGPTEVAKPADLAAVLSPLPIDLLDFPSGVREALSTAGVHTLGDVMELPRDGFSRRFGQAGLDQIDRALGRLPDPRPFFTPPGQFESRVEFPAEVENTEAILFPARRMLAELTGFLGGRGAGVRRFILRLDHAGHPPTMVETRLSAVSRDPARLLSLVRERLDRIRLPAPVRSLVLSADEVLPFRPVSDTLFPDPRLEPERWHVLMDRLRARLGEEAVHGLRPVADHRPERAWRMDGGPGEATALPRPLWLLETPEPLVVKDGRLWREAPLSFVSGPERIEAGWWDGAPMRRDYWFARDTAGAGYWIFRDAAGWHLHGYFG